VDTGHRLAQRVVVPDVAVVPRYGQVVDADGHGIRPHHRPDVTAVGNELPGHMRAEVTVGPDEQFLAHLRAPDWRGHPAATSGSVPSSSALRHHFLAAETNRSGL